MRACSFSILTTSFALLECDRAHKNDDTGRSGMRVTDETKNATRQRILDEAKKRFAQQGFEATTTRDIACAAGIAVGTLFNYFPTKESIVDYLVRDGYARAAEK